MNKKTIDLARRGYRDLFVFCKDILGFSDIREAPHRELCDFLMAPKKTRKDLVLMPRGSLKSTIISVGLPLWQLVRNNNLRFLISSETQLQSKAFLRQITSQIESNEKFIELYGDWKSQGFIWRDDQIMINRRTDLKVKEPSISTASLEKMTTTGYHYDRIILDDPVSLLNINTTDQLQKTIDHYKLLLSVLDPGPDKGVTIVGTRWHVGDLYGYLLENERDQIATHIRAAEDEKTGALLYPHRLTKSFLEEQKITQGPVIYANQYMNRPISGEAQPFKEEWFKYYDTLPTGLIYFMTIDPAISTSAHADFTAIIVVGVDYDHNWYICEARQSRARPMETINELFTLAEKYQPIMCLGVQKFILEKFLQAMLQTEMEKRDRYFPVKELPTDTRQSKQARILSLQPRLHAGKIWFRRDQWDLLEQFRMYPQVKHDDLLDAVQLMSQVTFPSDTKPEAKKEDALSMRERKIWKDVDKISRRSVRRTLGWD